ncbi:EAL domain-containing protein (putative c-di-GMP-specific phosphodiesterase class I) [Sinorhizobium terangae]|uniref:EAL domain-containing protein n=1 Tax=Sinorhizobium terangae TaxID=110322 RepID=A0A6N7LN28_SINTE|nr:EAL domain-containing protein [Sinorhizobium terangae]MBB4189242.1 EAL domain-containing protein (putative c-di-GMP-specific phosphodiesterase class I) [Sinorhizobium terangae]MQX19157.1 EAL domain-containing protein [Sinorhizobium terangae]
MNFDDVDSIVRTALQAMRQGRIGFSVQQVNCVNEHHEVFYSECLARLEKLDGTVITAGEFLPALEASGHAPELDCHMLNLAFEWLSNSASGPLGCNVSSSNFSSRERRTMLFDQLHRNRSLAPRLVLEITESAPIIQQFGVAEFIQDIRKLGYRIAIDDFGTGFSSPETIFSMAVDIIKIGAFFAQLSRRSEADRLLHHMVGLASCVAPTIVVEGIETYEQLTLARTAGATHVQGYLLSEPTLCPIFRGLGYPAVMDSTVRPGLKPIRFGKLSA